MNLNWILVFNEFQGNKMSSNIVYSTDKSLTCKTCHKLIINCVCGKEKTHLIGNGIIRVGRETQGRKGTGVSVITGLPLNAQELKTLAKDLKQKLGTGGTIKDGVIEIQGDRRDAIVAELIKKGFAAKRSGG
jgi:translation initiation factor 1